ncbi:MAG: hypothetical protein LBU51_02480, partial [Bacteroidales bacterium]|nr:hypothetical protein [Bacteroidales bacterium]
DAAGNGKLLNSKTYNANNVLVKEVTNTIREINQHAYFGINFKNHRNSHAHLYSVSTCEWTFCEGCAQNDDIKNSIIPSQANMSPTVSVIAHKLNTCDVIVDKITTTTDNVTVTEEYTYNPSTLQLKEKKISKSHNADKLSTKYLYPNDFNCGIFATMTTKNMLSPVIEEQVFNNGLYIGGMLTEYKTSDYGLIAPDKKYFSELTTPANNAPGYSCSGIPAWVFPSANVKYEKFDRQNNPVYLVHNDAAKIVYLWGYNYQYPIAEIQIGNYTYAEVETAVKNVFSVSSIDALSAQTTPNETILQNGSLQNALPNALVTTYTYKPLIGIKTATDPRRVKITYEYDVFGRLQYIKDYAGKTIESYDYHYKIE